MSSGVDDSERFNLPGVLAELAAKEWEALEVIKADICQWLAKILQLDISPSTFLDTLGTGVDLCQLATLIQAAASDATERGQSFLFKVPMEAISCNTKAPPESFYARDNASNFISWCRNLGVEEAVIFESEGLVLGKDEKRVILCLLDVARFAERVGVTPPQLVQMEREIDELERAVAKELQEREADIIAESVANGVNSKSSSATQSVLFSATPPSAMAPASLPSAKPPSAPPLSSTATISASLPPSAATPSAPPPPIVAATPSAPPPPTVAATPSAPPPPTVAATLTAPPPPTTPLVPPATPALSTKKSISRIPVRSSRRLANRRKEAPTPQRPASKPCQASRGRDIPTPLRSIGRPRKRARSEERESEEECHTPSRKKAKVGRTGKVDEAKTLVVEKVRESVDVRVMKKMAECTCRNKIAVTKCGNGKFIVKGASGKEMTTYARVLSDRLMVRVGGGWDTLDHFLLKHDPCRVHTLPVTGAGQGGGKRTGTLNR